MVSGQVGCLWSVEGNMKYLRDCTCDSSRDHDVTMLDISDDGHYNPFSSRMTPHTELAWPRVAVRNSVRELDDDQRTDASHGCRYQGFFISMRDPSVKCQGDTKNEKE